MTIQLQELAPAAGLRNRLRRRTSLGPNQILMVSSGRGRKPRELPAQASKTALSYCGKSARNNTTKALVKAEVSSRLATKPAVNTEPLAKRCLLEPASGANRPSTSETSNSLKPPSCSSQLSTGTTRHQRLQLFPATKGNRLFLDG